jgi:hypothetical protein
MKIHCGIKHFKEFNDVEFRSVGGVGDLKIK